MITYMLPKVLYRSKPCAFIFLVTLMTLSTCKSNIMNVGEGEEAQLDFPYPCDSTKVTLRHGYRAPFYSSVNPEAMSLPQNQLVNNQNGNDSGNCFIQLTIKPISRNDEGTYILTAYKNGHMLPEYPRIGLNVKYPPGRASWVSSTEYIDRDWVSLQFRAPVGTLPGQIVCYQNDKRVPPLTAPTVKGGTLYQNLLVELKGTVFCCSSAEDIKDRCECNDFGGDPILHEALDKIPAPCLVTTPKPSQDSTEESTTSIPTSNPLHTEPPNTDQNHLCIWEHVDIVVILAVIGILLLLIFFNLLYLSKITIVRKTSRDKETKEKE